METKVKAVICETPWKPATRNDGQKMGEERGLKNQSRDSPVIYGAMLLNDLSISREWDRKM